MCLERCIYSKLTGKFKDKFIIIPNPHHIWLLYCILRQYFVLFTKVERIVQKCCTIPMTLLEFHFQRCAFSFLRPIQKRVFSGKSVSSASTAASTSGSSSVAILPPRAMQTCDAPFHVLTLSLWKTQQRSGALLSSCRHRVLESSPVLT